MSYRVWLRPEASTELREAFQWYEQKTEGLGDEFLSCVDASIASIRRSPEVYAPVYREIRRTLVRRFPYGVFYFIDGQMIVIVAIFHTRRDPAT